MAYSLPSTSKDQMQLKEDDETKTSETLGTDQPSASSVSGIWATATSSSTGTLPKTRMAPIKKKGKKLGKSNRQFVYENDPILGRIGREDTKDVEDAILKNSISAVKYYYKQDPNIINKLLPNNVTPLFLAARMKSLGIARFLLLNGGNLKGDNNPNDEFHERYHLLQAALHGDALVVEFFLDEGYDINYQDDEGRTALHFAIMGNCYHVVTLLIDRGADISVADINNITPFNLAKKLQRNLMLHYLCTIKKQK